MKELQNSTQLKIADFGLAETLSTFSKITGTKNAGTLTTIVPEILEGKNYSFSADIWSLGSILYELVTGISPFLSDLEELTLKNVLACGYQNLPESTLDEI